MKTLRHRTRSLCCGITITVTLNENGEVLIEIKQVVRHYESNEDSPMLVGLTTSLAGWNTLTAFRQRMEIFLSRGQQADAELTSASFMYLLRTYSSCNDAALCDCITLHTLYRHWTWLDHHIKGMTREINSTP